MLLPATGRRVLAVVVGALLSVLVLVKVLDIGFFTAFNRPFSAVDDLSYVGIGIETLRDAIGSARANLAVAVAVVLIVALLVLPVLALLRVTRVAAGHRGWALRAVAALGVVWVVLRVLDTPVASSSAAALAVDEVQAVRTGLQDDEVLAREIARDRFGATPGDRLLTSLRGKDVLLVFVESYGAVALQNPRIGAVLDEGGAQLRPAASRRAAASSPRRPSAASAGWRTPRCRRGSGSTASAGTTSSSRTIASRSPRRSSARDGGRSPPSRRTGGRGRRARPSTATTRSTTAATSATAARASACRRCPTSTCSRPCSAASSAGGLRCSPRSTSSRAMRHGRRSLG